MIPDAATIARRRHVCTMIVRAGAVGLGAIGVWLIAREAAKAITAMVHGNLLSNALAGFIFHLDAIGPPAAMTVGLLLFERVIVRWIVPYPSREATCAQCGYSLKNLKSPICPECGTDIR